MLTLLGGALSNPAKQFGGVFKRVDFFTQYPYALPTFVTGAIGLSAAILAGVFVKEVCFLLSPDPSGVLIDIPDIETERKRR